MLKTGFAAGIGENEINGFGTVSFFESSFDVCVTLALLSEGFVLTVDKGTEVEEFKTDVVVVVLNVTTVLVDKFADFESLSSSFFSVFTILFKAETVSTSSFDSSPRRKLNIMANLVFDESFFLFKLKSVDFDDFGLTNEIEFSSSSSSSSSSLTSSLHSREMSVP